MSKMLQIIDPRTPVWNPKCYTLKKKAKILLIVLIWSRKLTYAMPLEGWMVEGARPQP
jgi:hypothetical protein